MKKKLAAILTGVFCISLLAGCGGSDENAGTTHSSIKEKIPTTESASTESTEEVDEDLPPKEGMVRNPLTNEWMEADLENKRPVAVMYPINKEGMPQYGYDNIDVFYEIMEEDKMSRQMGIMQDYHGLDKIGNIRSIRDYFVYAALEYDPIIVHFGGPELYVKDILTRSDVDNINGVGGVMGSDYDAFFRDNPDGRASEHTAYTSSELLESAIESAGFETDHRDEYYEPNHFSFASKNDPNLLDMDEATKATDLSLADAFPTTQPELKYNESDGKYYRSIYGEPQVDGETGTQLAFENVIVQWTYYEVRDAKGYLAFRMHDTTHDGFFFTEGKMIHVTWKKEGDYKPTTYYYDNGEEVQFNQGKTMIFVVQDDKPITVDGNTIQPSEYAE